MDRRRALCVSAVQKELTAKGAEDAEGKSIDGQPAACLQE